MKVFLYEWRLRCPHLREANCTVLGVSLWTSMVIHIALDVDTFASMGSVKWAEVGWWQRPKKRARRRQKRMEDSTRRAEQMEGLEWNNHRTDLTSSTKTGRIFMFFKKDSDNDKDKGKPHLWDLRGMWQFHHPESLPMSRGTFNWRRSS